MLYFLYELYGINILHYISFRAGLAFMLSFALGMLLFPRFIQWAKSNYKQPISTFIPSHKCKENTPTMGGAVFILSGISSALICSKLNNSLVLLGLATLVSFGLIGIYDDFTKVSRRMNAGMSAKFKFSAQVIISLLISYALYVIVGGDIYVPFMKSPLLSSSYLCIVFYAAVFLATSNAINITDGLDGLACVPSMFALVTLSFFVYIAGNQVFSSYLFWPKVSGAGELVVLSCALLGSLISFLWYNCHPAQIFMGDTGSLCLGGFIAYMAIVSNNEILLFLIGSVFVLETCSVILQIASFKIRKKRVFLMAPLHHHFEEKGLAENKIIVRFWIIALLSNLAALISIKIR